MAVIYSFCNKLEARVFVPGKPFQPSQVVRDKYSSSLWKPLITTVISFILQASELSLLNNYVGLKQDNNVTTHHWHYEFGHTTYFVVLLKSDLDAQQSSLGRNFFCMHFHDIQHNAILQYDI
jgi:hypothetical protein